MLPKEVTLTLNIGVIGATKVALILYLHTLITFGKSVAKESLAGASFCRPGHWYRRSGIQVRLYSSCLIRCWSELEQFQTSTATITSILVESLRLFNLNIVLVGSMLWLIGSCGSQSFLIGMESWGSSLDFRDSIQGSHSPLLWRLLVHIDHLLILTD